MDNTSKNDPVILEKIKLGHHLCSIYLDQQQQFCALIPIFIDSINKNQKCIYIIDDSTQQEVITAFKKSGFDLKKYLESQQFQFLTKKETYLRGDDFDPDTMIEFIKEIEYKALSDGYEGVCGTAETTWILESPSYQEKLIEYEARLNSYFPTSKFAAVCQYKETKSNQDMLLDIIRTHPFTIIYGKLYENKYFYSPPRYMKQIHGNIPTNAYHNVIDLIISG
jgi:hypothetical protein